jgi:hypothetical protein
MAQLLSQAQQMSQGFIILFPWQLIMMRASPKDEEKEETTDYTDFFCLKKFLF